MELVSLLAEAKPPATTLPCPGKPCTIISSLFLWHRLAFGYFPGLLGPVEMQPQKCIEIVQAFAAQATQVDGDSERLPPPSWQLNTSLSQPFYQKTQPLLWRMQNISGNVSSFCRGKQKSSSHNAMKQTLFNSKGQIYQIQYEEYVQTNQNCQCIPVLPSTSLQRVSLDKAFVSVSE